MLAFPDHDFGHTHLARASEGLSKQGVRLSGRLGRRCVVRGLVERDVYLGGVHEVHDVDALSRLDVGCLEVGRPNDHIAVFLVLISLDDLIERDLVARVVRPPVAHPAHVAAVEHAESHVLLGVLGGVERDRDGDQPETDSSIPKRAGHGLFLLARCV